MLTRAQDGAHPFRARPVWLRVYEIRNTEHSLSLTSIYVAIASFTVNSMPSRQTVASERGVPFGRCGYF